VLARAQGRVLQNLATQDHALNAGRPPPGRVMGDAKQIGRLDLYLADPQIAGLIKAYGGTAAPANGAVAQEQVRLYGQTHFDQLSRLSTAMGAVLSHYSRALAQAAQGGSGPGWTLRQTEPTETGFAGAAAAPLNCAPRNASTP
jgi:hypothetical protein